jgi:hypothetical protein
MGPFGELIMVILFMIVSLSILGDAESVVCFVLMPIVVVFVDVLGARAWLRLWADFRVRPPPARPPRESDVAMTMRRGRVFARWVRTKTEVDFRETEHPNTPPNPPTPNE